MKKLLSFIVIAMLTVLIMPNVLADAKENTPKYGAQYTVQSGNALQAILPIINAINNNYYALSEDQKLLLATTAGEAIGSNAKCRQRNKE